MRREAEYSIGKKSDSYIFAIERNSIPISLKNVYSFTNDDKSDGQRLLIIPTVKELISNENIEFYRANWRRIRWLFYSLFWLCWTLSLVLAILLAASHPKCDLSVRNWWKDSVIYEIWTISYGDMDGVGDLEAIRNGLENLRHLGVDALFLRPIVRVEKSGLGAIGHAELSSQIGTIADFSEFVKKAHGKNFRILIDFPLTITSMAHPWFDRSALASRPENSHFADFYFWRRGIPNSEFISAYKGSTLKYFHVKSRPELPVLSWNNANVSTSIKTALSFWIQLGVDGFHFSSIDYLHRSPDGKRPDWAEIAKILQTIRAHVEEEMGNSDKKIFLFTSHEHLSERTKALLVNEGLMDAVVHTELRKLAIGNKICSKQEASLAECANEIVADLLLFHQGDDRTKLWPLWSLGSPFTMRLAQRVNSQAVAELLVLLELFLPGTPFVYYGEEIGQKNGNRQCKNSPRGPLGWESTENGWSFGGNSSQLSKLSGLEQHYGHSSSAQHLARNFRRMVRLKKRSKTLSHGRAYITKPIDQQSFSLCHFLMVDEEEDDAAMNGIYGDVVILAANFGPTDMAVSLADLPGFHGRQSFEKGKVVARSINARNFAMNSFVDLRQKEVKLGPIQGVVIHASTGYY